MVPGPTPMTRTPAGSPFSMNSLRRTGVGPVASTGVGPVASTGVGPVAGAPASGAPGADAAAGPAPAAGGSGGTPHDRSATSNNTAGYSRGNRNVNLLPLPVSLSTRIS